MYITNIGTSLLLLFFAHTCMQVVYLTYISRFRLSAYCYVLWYHCRRFCYASFVLVHTLLSSYLAVQHILNIQVLFLLVYVCCCSFHVQIWTKSTKRHGMRNNLYRFCSHLFVSCEPWNHLSSMLKWLHTAIIVCFFMFVWLWKPFILLFVFVWLCIVHSL